MKILKVLKWIVLAYIVMLPFIMYTENQRAVELGFDSVFPYLDAKEVGITNAKDYALFLKKSTAEQELIKQKFEAKKQKKHDEAKAKAFAQFEAEKEADYFMAAVESIKVNHVLRTIKKSYDVRLKYPISKAALKNLAIKIKNDDPRDYERTFILYWLPGMKEGSGAWASTHFNPDLRIDIIGFDLEQLAKLKKWKVQLKSEAIPENRIGLWWADWNILTGSIQIDETDGKTILKWSYHDGTSSTKELIKKKSENGIFYWEKNGREGYLLREDGWLEVRDNTGIIFIAKPIK